VTVVTEGALIVATADAAHPFVPDDKPRLASKGVAVSTPRHAAHSKDPSRADPNVNVIDAGTDSGTVYRHKPADTALPPDGEDHGRGDPAPDGTTVGAAAPAVWFKG